MPRHGTLDAAVLYIQLSGRQLQFSVDDVISRLGGVELCERSHGEAYNSRSRRSGTVLIV